jgi:hypothetical protein
MSRRLLTGSLVAVAMGASAALGGCTPDTPDDASVDLAELRAIDAQLGEIEAAFERVGTYESIWENELRYTRGLDRHDLDLERSVFWSDAAISYGAPLNLDDIDTWANVSHANNAAHQHHVTGLTLDISGSTAHEEGDILYSSDVVRDKSLDVPGTATPGRAVAGSKATLGTGRYVNRYERRNGEWRMIVHEYVHDVSLRLDAVDLCSTGCLGRWDRTDISYLRPLESLTVDERQRRAEQSKRPGTRPVAAGSQPFNLRDSE